MEAFCNGCLHGVVKCSCPCRTKVNVRLFVGLGELSLELI